MRKEFYNIDLLEYISDEDLDKFTHKVEIKEVKKGTIIFRYNDLAEYMYIIVDGLDEAAIDKVLIFYYTKLNLCRASGQYVSFYF